MADQTLTECACGATFLGTGDEQDCATCAAQLRRSCLSSVSYEAPALFFAPQTLCGQMALRGDS